MSIATRPRNLRALLGLVIALILAAPLAACTQGSGVVHAERLWVEDCTGSGEDGGKLYAPFDLRLAFMSAFRNGDQFLIRASDEARWQDRTDQLTFHIHNYLELDTAVTTDGEAIVRVEEGDVTVGLALIDSCPKSTVPLVAETGWLRFTHLGSLEGDRVTAEFAFDLVDGRTGEQLGEGFEGNLDFEIAVGTPFELFNDVDAGHGQTDESPGF